MDKLNLNKEQVRNMLVAFIILLVIVGLLFYLKRPKADLVGDISGAPADITQNQTPGVGPLGAPSNTTTTTAQPKPTVEFNTANKLKFDTALKNGSDAFLLGNYDQAISFYNQALAYQKSDVVYIRLYTVYNVQNDIPKAMSALESAIKVKPSFTDYWVTKIAFLDEKTSSTFLDLKKVYQEGLAKSDPKTKVNLVTSFAVVAEHNSQYSEAIALWEYAKVLYPNRQEMYQTEINRLKSL